MNAVTQTMRFKILHVKGVISFLLPCAGSPTENLAFKLRCQYGKQRRINTSLTKTRYLSLKMSKTFTFISVVACMMQKNSYMSEKIFYMRIYNRIISQNLPLVHLAKAYSEC